MARANIQEEETKNMRRFPTQHGQYVAIGSEEISEQSIATAITKLTKEQQETTALIQDQEKTLERMQGKAPQERIQEKQEIITKATARLAEITASLELLK